MKKHIYFVTTNTNKFEEVNQWLKELEPTINLEQAKFDIPEIQSLDVKEVASTKTHDAWSKLQKPLLIDDEGLYLEKYPLFPGTLTKLVRKAIGIEGILQLAGDNKNAFIINCLVYIESSEKFELFEGITKGKLIEPVGGDKDKKLKSIDVLVPEGYDKTFSELEKIGQSKNFHYRYQALKSFISWLNNKK